MSGFVLHPDALRDLDEIWEFIATDSLDAADRVLEEIRETMTRIAAFPHLGHTRPDLSSRGLRFHPVREYLIAYAPAEEPLLIIGVLHGGRSPRVIAALLRGRK